MSSPGILYSQIWRFHKYCRSFWLQSLSHGTCCLRTDDNLCYILFSSPIFELAAGEIDDRTKYDQLCGNKGVVLVFYLRKFEDSTNIAEAFGFKDCHMELVVCALMIICVTSCFLDLYLNFQLEKLTPAQSMITDFEVKNI